MVQPIDFGFNEQTGLDNEYQNRPSQAQSNQVTQAANQEFDKCVELLRKHNVSVQVLGKAPSNNKVPDAVFPNNWFSTRSNGDLIIYPMKTPNRQAEIQVAELSSQFETNNFSLEHVIDLREEFRSSGILEGTGSLIFHHPSNYLFAAISERCQSNPLRHFAEQFGYRLVEFSTQSSKGKPIYHTNVLMSIGENFAVITKDILINDHKTKVLHQLSDIVDEVIEITEHQMNRFCGNILQLKNAHNEPLIIMSRSAYDGFNRHQRITLENNGSLLIFEIPTIESIGGGSARCMIAENFLPKS